MFKFLWQRDKEMQSLAEIIAVDMEKLNLSKLAIEKAVMMIAKAIAKSDILIQTESKEKNKQEYRLNIRLMMRADGNISMTMQLLRCHHSMANSCSVLKIKKKVIQE